MRLEPPTCLFVHVDWAADLERFPTRWELLLRPENAQVFEMEPRMPVAEAADSPPYAMQGAGVHAPALDQWEWNHAHPPRGSRRARAAPSRLPGSASRRRSQPRRGLHHTWRGAGDLAARSRRSSPSGQEIARSGDLTASPIAPEPPAKPGTSAGSRPCDRPMNLRQDNGARSTTRAWGSIRPDGRPKRDPASPEPNREGDR